MSPDLNNIWLNSKPTDKEVNIVLAEVWGGKSFIGQLHDTNRGLVKAVTIVDRCIPIGCVAYMINPGKELELGSLVVLPKYRGIGLSKLLFDWMRESVQKNYDGFSLTTYATIGSSVLYSIVKTMENIKGAKCLPLNVGLGIVPVSQKKAEMNIAKEVLVPEKGGFNLNSTIQISTLPKMLFGDLKLWPSIGTYMGKIEYVDFVFVDTENILISLPILLDLYIVKNTKADAVNKFMDTMGKKSGRKLKICIPADKRYNKIVSCLISRRLIFGGVSIIDGGLYLVFLNNIPTNSKQIIEYISKFPDKEISRFGRFILETNREMKSNYFL
ncbi:GNAT family N-acetyltransferase [Candidatus Shapirobacteria bacterium]|nr:GNAT family N-acetyltransferase [Candidatus Shapirobacteria bacterium]